MKKLFLSLFLSCGIAYAAPSVPVLQSVPPHVLPPASKASPGDEVAVDLRDVDVASIVALLYSEILTGAYALSPDVITDHRKVSLRWSGRQSDALAMFKIWLADLGYSLTDRAGMAYLGKSVKPERDLKTLIYYPKYNTASSLREIVSGFVGGSFTGSRGVPVPSDMSAGITAAVTDAKPGTAASVIDRDERMLIFRGTEQEKQLVAELLEQVDIPVGSVTVSGVIYEVSTKKGQGSAITLAGSILGARLGVQFGGAVQNNALRLSLGKLDAVVSALDSDSRFKVVSAPRLRVRSGAVAKLTVGQDVPVAGAVVPGQNGSAPIRSVEYRSSGVIFDLKPTVFKDVIRLAFTQQMSSFVKTETGINESPTLIKREAHTDLDVRPGELIVVGGLVDNSSSGSRSGLPFLPMWMDSTTDTNSASELLVLLQVEKDD